MKTIKKVMASIMTCIMIGASLLFATPTLAVDVPEATLNINFPVGVATVECTGTYDEGVVINENMGMIEIQFVTKNVIPDFMTFTITLSEGYVLDADALSQNMSCGRIFVGKNSDAEYVMTMSEIEDAFEGGPSNALVLSSYIKYGKTPDEIMAMIADNGVIAFDSVEFTGSDLNQLFMRKLTKLGLNLINGMSIRLDVNENKVIISDNMGGTSKEYPVTYSFEQADASVIKKAKELLDGLKGTDFNIMNQAVKLYPLEDMDLINYYCNQSVVTGSKAVPTPEALGYSSPFRKEIENSSLEIEMCNVKGNGLDFVTRYFGTVFVSYKGTIVAVRNKPFAGVYLFNVVYVPDETEKTDEAYIAAAQKRIKEYTGLDVAMWKKPDTIQNVVDSFKEMLGDASLLDTSRSTGSTYVFTINGHDYEFAILADSSKMINPEVVSRDMVTDISVKSES